MAATADQRPGTGRRRTAAALSLAAGALLLVTGCSTGGGTSGSNATTAPTDSTAPAPIAASTPTAAQARDRAVAATSGLHSYTFASTSSVGHTSIRVVGRAVLPDRVAARIIRTGQTQDTVRVSNTLYVRTAGTWARTPKAVANTSPLSGLIGALQASQGLTADPGGRHLSGQISAADAARLGLLKTGTVKAPLPVAFSLDPTGHVVRFSLTATLVTGSGTVPFTETTSYAGFDAAQPISKP